MNVARNWIDNVYEVEHRALDELVGQKEWEYQTNINDDTSAASVSHLANSIPQIIIHFRF